MRSYGHSYEAMSVLGFLFVRCLGQPPIQLVFTKFSSGKKQPRIGISSSGRPNERPKTIFTDTFTVTHCNVRGLWSKLDHLQHIVNEVSLLSCVYPRPT